MFLAKTYEITFYVPEESFKKPQKTTNKYKANTLNANIKVYLALLYQLIFWWF